jgi:hypothetical protein
MAVMIQDLEVAWDETDQAELSEQIEQRHHGID